MPGTISRRSLVALLGAGGLASAIAGHTATGGVAGRGPVLAVGQTFGRWTISAVHPIQDGALLLGVKGESGHEFMLEILARDASPLAPTPPASTESLAIFVRNGGNGASPTAEEHAQAATTLAAVLSASGPIAGLLTHSDRLVQHRATLVGEVPGALRHTA